MTETDICNMALGRIGANRLTSTTTIDADTTVQGIQCRLYYDPTRDALLRSFDWSFAKTRKSLELHPDAPDFEWDHQYKLPDDYLRMRSNYTIDDTNDVDDRYVIEGDRLLTNEDEAEIRYIRKVTDPDEFDPLFVEVFVLQLSLKLLPTLAGTQTGTFRQELKDELKAVLSKARVVALQESNITGRRTHIQSRLTD